jgi:exoribonuclease R
MAGRASVQLHTLIFFSGDDAKEDDAYVLDIDTAEMSEPSFTVIIPRYGIEGRVQIPLAADDPHLVREPEKHRIMYNKDGVKASIQVFDKVKVKIWVREVQDHQRELVVELIEPKFHSAIGKRGLKDGTVATASDKKKKRKM